MPIVIRSYRDEDWPQVAAIWSLAFFAGEPIARDHRIMRHADRSTIFIAEDEEETAAANLIRMNALRARFESLLIWFGVAAAFLFSTLPAAAYSTLDLAYIPSKWGFIDRNGKVVVEPGYTRAEDFSEGLAAVKIGGTHFLGGKWGFINREGKTIIEPKFDQALSFHEGLASVCIGGKWGVIDTSGTMVIAPQFGLVWEFHQGLASFKEYRGEKDAYSNGGNWGYLNREGKIVIPSKFASAGSFSEGLASVTMPAAGDGFPPCGYIDLTGRMVIEPRFDLGFIFSEGLAAVKQGKQIGYIDRSGRWAIQPKFYFSWQQNFLDGLATVSLTEKRQEQAVIDKSGMIIRRFGPPFNNVRYFPSSGTLVGIVWDSTMPLSRAVSFNLEQAAPHEGMIEIYQDDRGFNSTDGATLHGFADTAGKVVIPPRFEHVDDFHEGRAKFAVNIDWKATRDADEAMEKSGNWSF